VELLGRRDFLPRQPSRSSVGGVRKNPQVPTSATRRSGTRCSDVYRAERIGEACQWWSRGHPALSDGVGQCDEVILVGIGRQRRGVAHQLPTAGGGDPAGVPDTQVPGVRLAGNSQRSHDGGRV